MRHDICALLRSNPYPGRGIIIGGSPDGKKAVIVYFIMGRSANSRNRVFVITNDGIRTQAHDPDTLADPSLVIYTPVRRIAGFDALYIVTNGDQTDTLADYLATGRTYVQALETREFEPDPPIYTPRISGLLYRDGAYMLSILKSADNDPACCLRHYFTYDAPIPGTCHFIHTYGGNGDPPPSFQGEPLCVKLPDGGPERIANSIWDALDADNKVSLYVNTVEMDSGQSEVAIINKNM